MQGDHFVWAMDKCHRPIEFNTLRWSSEQTAWAGFRVESRVLGPRGALGSHEVGDVLVGLCIGGEGELHIPGDGTVRRVISSPGRFSLIRGIVDRGPIEWTGTRDMVCVAIDTKALDRLGGCDTDFSRLGWSPQFAVRDRQVAALVNNMHDEAHAGSPAGRVYGESLSLALAVYLLRRYCEAPAASGRGVPTLAPAHLRRIREYVRANLAGDVSLIELAGQAQLSPHYFAMQFKRAFGISPHRYVLRERVLEAQQRLASHRMSISEVALSLGFSDQSHFSHAFRRLTGTTPKRFQSTR